MLSGDAGCVGVYRDHLHVERAPEQESLGRDGYRLRPAPQPLREQDHDAAGLAGVVARQVLSLQVSVSSADRITVLRHGAVVRTISNEGVTAETLVSMMLDIDTPSQVRNTPVDTESHANAAIEFKDVWTSEENDPRGLHGISFRAMPGEILGVAGVSGNGQQDLGEALLGIVPRRKGSIFLAGQDVKGWSVAAILEAGVSYIPEDPISMSMVPDMRVDENLALGELSSYGNGGIWLDRGRINGKIKKALNEFPLDIAP